VKERERLTGWCKKYRSSRQSDFPSQRYSQFPSAQTVGIVGLRIVVDEHSVPATWKDMLALPGFDEEGVK
jgi:hypothetical protein